MSTVAETLRAAADSLRQQSDSPRLDAELLLGKVLGISRAALIARHGDGLANDCEHAYADLIAQRRAGAPVAYLTGTREFWSLPLTVTPAVLVPRPETETLVELALQLIPALQENISPDPTRSQIAGSNRAPATQAIPGLSGDGSAVASPAAPSILDLGTGSGAIALAIASESPTSRITAADISPEALKIAMHNSRALGMTQIDWRLGSWFDAVPGERFDLIVSNPPYVAAADPALADLSHEPMQALTPGPTGLEALAQIAAGAPLHLHQDGWLILEHGSGQAADVAHLLERHGFTGIRSHDDFSGKSRVTLGTLHTQQGTS